MSPLGPFRNEPVLELRRAAAREQLQAGMAALERKLPLRVPMWIGGEERHGDALVSTDPGHPERVVAHAAMATESDVDAAVRAATEAFPAWSRTPAERRAEILVRAADWLRRNRAMLAALEVRECAKPWGEADADVCEAIDFCEYYAREALSLIHI